MEVYDAVIIGIAIGWITAAIIALISWPEGD